MKMERIFGIIAVEHSVFNKAQDDEFWHLTLKQVIGDFQLSITVRIVKVFTSISSHLSN